MTDTERIVAIFKTVKPLAREYRAITGKPLGITGEVAEFEAARHLGLKLTSARQAGYDAIDPVSGRTFQIKGRCVYVDSKPGQRVGSIDLTKPFDMVLLVLLDEHLDATHIYEADRANVIEALLRPGSRSRNQRGAMGVAMFKRIGRRVWERSGARRAGVGGE